MRSEDALALLATLVIVVLAVRGWQRSRYRYELAKLAIERGNAGGQFLAKGPPLWLLSARQGAMLIAGGISCLIVSAVLVALAKTPPIPHDAVPTTMAAAVAADEPSEAARRLDRPAHSRAGRTQEIEERARDMRTVAVGLTGVSGILVLLGVVRLAFAFLERRYTPGEVEQHPEL